MMTVKIFPFKFYRYVRENMLNFVVEHPVLVRLFVGLGISFTFASLGRLAIHEILQPGYAIPPATCANCAKEFSPGQDQQFPGDAPDLSPGHDQKSPGDAQDLAPGELKQKEIGCVL